MFCCFPSWLSLPLPPPPQQNKKKASLFFWLVLSGLMCTFLAWFPSFVLISLSWSSRYLWRGLQIENLSPTVFIDVITDWHSIALVVFGRNSIGCLCLTMSMNCTIHYIVSMLSAHVGSDIGWKCVHILICPLGWSPSSLRPPFETEKLFLVFSLLWFLSL